MFESYENQSSRRVMKLALVVFFGLTLFVAAIHLTCRTAEDSAVMIQRSEKLTEHDNFCMSLPRPADFQLLYKSLGGNSKTTAIDYTFASKRLFRDVKDFFSHELTSNGWVSTNDVTYQKDQYEITIGHKSAGFGDVPAEYYIYCAKKYY